MQHQFEILRFKEGARSRHPSPEASVAAAQPDTLADAGSQLAVLVDLTPQLPYRSREIRTLVVKSYWASSGSIVARLRRALAAANRHLVAFNQKALAGSKCSGNITVAVFSDEELFLGQVGAAYAYVLVPTEPSFELFPKRDRLLVPLGATAPPLIHVGYTAMPPGSIACLATTRIAESQARETWQEMLAQSKLNLISSELSREIANSKLTGSVILMRAQAAPPPLPVARSRPSRHPAREANRAAAPQAVPPSKAGIAAPSAAVQKEPPKAAAGAPAETSPAVAPSGGSHKPSADGTPVAADLRPTVPTSRPHISQPARPQTAQSQAAAPQAPPTRTASTPEPRPRPSISLPKVSPPPVGLWVSSIKARWQARSELRKARVTDRSTTAERARLRQAWRTLLPGKVEGSLPAAQRTPPPERAQVLGGLALGLFLVVVLITLTKYLQLGGPLKAEALLEQAQVQLEDVYISQDPDEWYRLKKLVDQVVVLDPQNAEALDLQEEVNQAIDALENAALLNVSQLLDLGTAPQPRHILVASGWLYILNTATDSVVAQPLNPDYLSSPADSPTTILKKGQTYNGQVVNHLVDLAWIQPGLDYPDGAVLIYSEGGMIFIYEPALGPGSTTTQMIQGNLAAGNITNMETFGDTFYLINRQQNQVLLYEPVNGIYDNPRPYFAEDAAPDLQLTLDMGIDGRIYLLMGDGSLQTFYAGSPDHSFALNNLPEADFTPTVMAIEPDPDEGMIYLADSQRERIFVVNKRGNFQFQFRLPRGQFQRIESLAVNMSPHVLYLVANNKLYVAPIPEITPR